MKILLKKSITFDVLFQVYWLKNGKWFEDFHDTDGKSTFSLYAYMKMFGEGVQTIQNDILTRQADVLQYELQRSESSDYEHFKANEYLSRGVLLDTSPSNYLEEHMKKIAHFFPNAKVIMIMRDPVERLFSLYRYNFQLSTQSQFQAENQNSDAFHQYIVRALKRKILSSRITIDYHIYVKAALKYFKKENLMFLQFEEFVEDSMGMIESKVLPFLNLDPYELETRLSILRDINRGKIKNKSKQSYSMLNETRVLLRKHFLPYNHRLAKLFNDEKWTWGY